MTLGDAVRYARKNPHRLPNTGGSFHCADCGRRFHRAHEGCPACGGALKRRLVA